MKFKFFLFLVGCAAIAVSYFYAPEVYRYYLAFYYQKIEKVDEAALVKKIEQAYNNKDYARVKRYCEHGSMLYPANKKIKKYTGLYLLSQDNVKGAFILIALDDIPNDTHHLEKIITTLDANRSYKEVIMVVAKKGAHTPVMQLCYGKALFYMGNDRQALIVLKQAYERGMRECDYFIGASYYHLKDYKNALAWYRKALQREPENKMYIKAIASLYKKMGDYQKATQYIMRLQQ
ncbi:MAG: tetratricopeptide repeat protein [Spirochaetota bacterium]